MAKIKVYAVRKWEGCFGITRQFPEDIMDGWFGPMFIEEKDYEAYEKICYYLEGAYQIIHKNKEHIGEL